MMTDRYPPSRPHVGGQEPDGVVPVPAPGAPAGSTPLAAKTPPPQPPRDIPRQDARCDAGAPGGRGAWTTRGIVATVIGCLVAIVGLGLAGAGGVLALAGATQRDGGFVMTPTAAVDSDTYAVTSEGGVINTQIETGGGSAWMPSMSLGEVQIRAQTHDGRPLFVGIAATSDVESYLGDVSRATVSEFRAGHVVLQSAAGGARVDRPAKEKFWVAQETGREATLAWDLKDGDWTVVLMRADGNQGISADISTGVELAVVHTVMAVLFLLAGLTLLAGALLIGVPVWRASRRKRAGGQWYP